MERKRENHSHRIGRCRGREINTHKEKETSMDTDINGQSERASERERERERAIAGKSVFLNT